MDCIETRKILYDYIEGNSPADQQALIKEHLQSCAECRLYEAESKKTIKRLHGLDEIEPPAWLTTKVMAKVREEGPLRENWIKKLFYPLHIKLPLEAIATLLITVAAIVIVKNMGPELKQIEMQPQGPVVNNMPARSEKDRQEEWPQKKEMPQPLRNEEMRRDSATTTKTRELTVLKEEKTVEQVAPVIAPTMPEASSSFAPSPALAPATRHAETGKASGLAARDEMMQETAPAAPRSELSIKKMRKGLETVTLAVKATDVARNEIETYLVRNNGELKTIEELESRFIVTIKLDPSNIGKFLTHLEKLGTIKENRQRLSPQGSLFILIIEKQ